MKFTQIAVASDTENGETLYALGNDGNIYECFRTHYGPGDKYQGRRITRGHVVTGLFWKKLELPLEEPALTRRELELFEFQDERSEV